MRVSREGEGEGEGEGEAEGEGEGEGEGWGWPRASILETSRMSLTRLSRCSPDM